MSTKSEIKKLSKAAQKQLGLIESGVINLPGLKNFLKKVIAIDNEHKPLKRKNLKDQRIMNFEALYASQKRKKH